jgi:hypothetical protein
MASDTDVFDCASQTMLDRHPGDERGRMLRAPGLKTAGRFYAFATDHHLVVKLSAARVAELITAGAGRPCDPRRGRPMRQWVRLRPADHPSCTTYLIEARGFVSGLSNH